ncbi:MAG: response regulator [Ignavibacteriae bacterium]|nr:response regulator [Ignavibacteriota bacterium]
MTKKNNIKELIIDDNISILQYLKTLLQRFNFEIKTSSNGYEGLQDSAEFKPDIIFLDLMMPNIDGIKMLQLKKVLNDIKEIPVIVISANAGRHNVLAAIEAGADRVLAKPINVKQLKATVNELIGYDCFERNDSVELNEELENIKNKEHSELPEKFEELKIILTNAIIEREPKIITETASSLIDYAKTVSDKIVKELLTDLRNKEYHKPSDWMFAELLIKQISHEVSKLNKSNYVN